MKKKINVSVVIPTYNGWDTLKDGLESLMKQSLSPYEIIVVDNASEDGTYEKISSFAKATEDKQKLKIKIFRNTKNLGVTGGRNRGIKETNKNSDYIFFFDHDMVADKKMMEELVEVAEIKKNIGIVTPKIYYWDNRDVIWSAGTDVNLLTGQTIFFGGKDVGQYDQIKEVAVAPAAILVKKEVIEKIGDFDPIYFATYEDTDFCFRAKKYGFLTYYSPKAIAYHKIPCNVNDSTIRLLERTYWIGRNRVIFMKRFGKYFLVFLFFLPLYFIHYFIMSIRYKNLKSLYDFTKGTIHGLFA